MAKTIDTERRLVAIFAARAALCSAAIVVALTCATAAMADGGAGGGFFTSGGLGGADSSTGVGANGGDGAVGGGGGGGSGATGGAGGTGAFGGGAGGAGGAAAGVSGLSGASGGGGSGGGGGGGAHGFVGAGLPGSAVTGGRGGDGGSGAGGGGGGAGGWGAVITGSGVLGTLGINVTGGNGGDGGIGGFSAGGGGGSGGIGLAFTGTPVTVTIAGNVAGGNGGALGGGHTPPFPTSAGGVGIAGSGLTLTITGSVSGGLSGDLATRADAITFTGGTNVLELQAGSIIIGNVVGTGTDTFRLGGAANGSFDVSTLGAGQQYQGFAEFEKAGISTWTLTGTQTDTTPWTVNAGTLSVDGSIASSTLITVNAGGTLGGNGIVGNTTVNGGTLSPGNSIGLLTVQGNLVFTGAASYLVEVSPANADRVNVTGTATLGNATVSASFAPGSFVAKQYTILNAAGGVSGTFGAQINTNLPSDFHSSLSYDANNAYLNLALNFVPPPGTGLNGNQQNVANAVVGFFNSNGSIPIVFGGLTPAGLTEISGETATGSQETTFNAMNMFMGLLTDPFIDGRGNPVAADASGGSAYAAQEPRPSAARDAYAAIYRKAPAAADPFVQRWSVWAAGYGGAQSTDGNAVLGSNNTTSRIFGVAVGADYRLSPSTLAGFALAGGGTSFAVANVLGSGRSDLFQAGAFIRHNAGAAYLSGALAYGFQDVTTDRTVTVAGVDRLRAEFNANAWSGRLEGGYRFVTQGFGATPYAAGQFTTFDLPAYAEQAIVGANTFALAYNAKSVTDTRSELGIRTDKSFAMADAILTLRGRAAWAHDFNPDRAIAATFQTLPGASFVVSGAALAPDSALVTGSAEMKWLNGWSAAATFEGEFSNVTRSYAGKGVVRYSW